MSTENLKLWNKVEKTNPKYTKNANVRGNKITSISPQFQIMNVTSEFGVYGKTWGFKRLDFDYSLKEVGLIVLNATFFFPDGEFEIINSIGLYIDNAKTKIDNDFAKKIETDTLTKAVSKLGFNADIFMGKFDDTRYVAEMNEEFNPPPPPAPKPIPTLTAKQFETLMTKDSATIEKYLEKIEAGELIVNQGQHVELSEQFEKLLNQE